METIYEKACLSCIISLHKSYLKDMSEEQANSKLSEFIIKSIGNKLNIKEATKNKEANYYLKEAIDILESKKTYEIQHKLDLLKIRNILS